MLGVEESARNFAHAVSGSTHALQCGSDRGRGCHLNYEVYVAHVDAQLQGAGGDHAAQGSALERFLDEGALFLGHGAVVRAGERRHLGDVADACRVVFGIDSLLREDATQVNIVERRGELFR